LPALLTQLEQVLDETQERENIARPRLPIDRVFTMTGFGTVVTGTLLDGSFKLGQEIEVLPQAIRTRIRTLQTHRHQVKVAHPGSRVAINLANVARTDLERGNIVALPGQLRPTILIDAHIQLLADAPRPLTHNTLVDFYSGSQEVPARIRLLDVEELKPGQSSWVQLRLSRPAVVARRDRFILRIPSPSITIGGGEVVDVQPRYHRRFQPSVLNALATLERGSPEELVLAALDRRRERTVGAGVVGSGEEELASARRKKDGTQPTARSAGGGARLLHALIGYDLVDIVKHSNLSQDVTQQTLETLLKAGRVRRIGLLWFAQPVWEALADEAIQLVREQHRQYPLRSGLSKEEWRTRLHLSAKMATEVFTALHAEGLLEAVTGETGITGGFIRLPGFVPTFTAAQQQLVERLLRKFYQSPYTPPVYAEAESIVGPEILASLIEQGRLVKLSDGVLFLRETHDEAVAKLVAYLKEHGKMTAAEARDVLGTSRKYVLPLLEHMDEQRITRRKGDDRVLAMQA